MTLTVTHQFVSGVADDPTAAAAGEVLPSHWNANHVVTGVALQVATGNISLFVSNLGSDSNDGSAAHPFATIQHAVNVATSYDYQLLYNANIKAAAGVYPENLLVGELFYGFPTTANISALGSTAPTLIITGDSTTPANCKIAPTTGNNTSIISFRGGYPGLDGFRLVADPNIVGSTDSMVATNQSILSTGTLEFDTGAGQLYLLVIENHNFSFTFGGLGSGNLSWGFLGSGVQFSISDCNDFSRFILTPGNFVFNTAWVFPGNAGVFRTRNRAITDFASLIAVGGSFVNAGNLTGTYPIQAISSSTIFVGQDPFTVTWPSGPFVTVFGGASTIDASSEIDGFPYSQANAGTLVDESTIYRGSWVVTHDTVNGHTNFVYDNGGTLGFPGIPVLILANGTSAEGIFVYNTVDTPYGTPTNYERAVFDWTTNPNVLTIGTQKGGTGSQRQINFVTSGNTFLTINSAGTQVTFNTNAYNSNQWLSLGSCFTVNNAGNSQNLDSLGLVFGSGLQMVSNHLVTWSNSATALSGFDTGLSRSAANVVEINNGTAGTGPGVLKLAGTTVGGLPGTPAAGEVAYVTDGSAGLTFGNTVTGGHATPYLVWYNGTNWTVMGI